MSIPSRQPLSPDAIDTALEELEGWAFEEDMLRRTFEFSTFREAMSFMVRVGFEAEALNHHPELTNVYGQVQVALTTHDSGDKVTNQDVELARRINHFSWV